MSPDRIRTCISDRPWPRQLSPALLCISMTNTVPKRNFECTTSWLIKIPCDIIIWRRLSSLINHHMLIMAVLAMLRRPFYLPSGEEVVSGWEPCLPQPTEEQDADHLRAALTANGVYLSADQLPAGGLPPLWEYKVDGKAADNGLFHLRFFPFWEKKLPGKRGQFHLVKFDIQKFSKEANTVAAMKAFVLASPPPESVPCKQLVRMAQSSVARPQKPST